MGWSFRKSFSLIPGVRLNLSRNGPRLSVGVRGAHVSVGPDGNTKLYGGLGPLRYQKSLRADPVANSRFSLGEFIRRLFS